jgi:hypothetical protein
VKPEKSYFYKPDETRIVKKVLKKRRDTASETKVPLTTPESETKQVTREELKVH